MSDFQIFSVIVMLSVPYFLMISNPE